MPSWKIPAVPGYENLDPLDVLNGVHLLGKAVDNQTQQNSAGNDQNTNINNQDKSAGRAERQFHLSLGLADPRLQQGSQHLGFGSLDADSTGSFSEILTATHEHPSLSFRPALTVLPTSNNSRFRQLFQQKMAAEAGRQQSLAQSSNGSERAGPEALQQEPSLEQNRNPGWSQNSSMPPGNGNSLAVNTQHAEELAGYGRAGDSQEDLVRPATSDGVVFLNKSPAAQAQAQAQAGERHPVSADANLPVPLPAWQNPMASTSAYRPQAQQSPYYQRMLAAKLAAAQQEDPLNVKDESNNYIPPMGQPEMAYMPSTYSPMYQMFSNGGGLDGHYQAQHTPQGQAQNEPWNMHNQQTQHQSHYGPGSEDAGYLGLVNGSNQSGSHNGGYPDHYSAHGTPWNQYYPQDGSNSRNPQHSQTPGPSAPGQWNRHDAHPDVEVPPPAVEDWMAAWPHIKNPGQEPVKPVPSSSRKKADAEPKPRKDSSNVSVSAGKGGDQPKKAALACHFCRGRKLKCDAVRPTCAHCAKRSLSCSYDVEIRRRGPGKRKKELLAQQQARANGDPYNSDDTKNGSSRKRKSGDAGSDQDEGSPSDSVGLHSGSGPDMSVQPSSSNLDQYSQQAYSAHSMSAPYDAYQQQQHYSNQMYQHNPMEAYHHPSYAAAYHPQYDAVSNDRSRPMSHGYEVLGGGHPYPQGYMGGRPGGGGPDEHSSKRVKLEG